MAQASSSTPDTTRLFGNQSNPIDVKYFHHQDLADLEIHVDSGLSLQKFGVFKAALEAVSNKLKSAIAESYIVKLEHLNAPSGLPIAAFPEDNSRAFSLFLAILFQQGQNLLKVPSRSDLLVFAYFCTHYNLLTLVSSQVRLWSHKFRWPRPPYDYPEPQKWVTAHEKMLKASFIFKDDIMFSRTLRRIDLFTILGDNDELVWDLEEILPGTALFVNQMLLPPGVADYMKATKAYQMRHFVETVRRYVLDLVDGSNTVVCVNGKQPCKDFIVGSLSRHVRQAGITLTSCGYTDKNFKRKRVENDPEIQITSEHLAMDPEEAVDQLDVSRISVGRLAYKLISSELRGLCDGDESSCGPKATWSACVKKPSLPFPGFRLVDSERAMVGIVRDYKTDNVKDFDRTDDVKVETTG